MNTKFQKPKSKEAYGGWQTGLSVGRAKNCRSALQIKPNFPGAHAKLAFALEASGEYDQAVKYYTQALRTEPDRTGIMNNLAWLIATHNKAEFYDPKRAIDLAERACELTKYQDPSLLDTLAAAYAAAGNFTQAVRTAEKG